jgi:hypothetical protein
VQPTLEKVFTIHALSASECKPTILDGCTSAVGVARVVDLDAPRVWQGCAYSVGNLLVTVRKCVVTIAGRIVPGDERGPIDSHNAGA